MQLICGFKGCEKNSVEGIQLCEEHKKQLYEASKFALGEIVSEWARRGIEKGDIEAFVASIEMMMQAK